MCSTCARLARATFLNNAAVTEADASGAHFARSGTTAFLSVGDLGLMNSPVAALGVTPDDAGDGIGRAPGNPIIVADDAPRVGSLGTNGDQDYYRVELVAGQTYEIGLFGFRAPVTDTNRVGVPVPDLFLEVYDAAGKFIVNADGGAQTDVNAVNNGFDVLLTYKAETTGIYYLNAKAFNNGAGGEGVGDYQIFAREVDPAAAGVYTPYYKTDNPLYALDWGSQVNKENVSVRNPDGQEGPRPTGNAQGTPIIAAGVAELAAAQGVDITGKNVITIYFAKAGDVFTSENPASPGLPPVTVTSVAAQAFERNAVFAALNEFEKVADVVYVEVNNRDDADFIYSSYQGTPGPGVSLLGSMSPPDEDNEGLAQFNSGDNRWNARDLAQGGFSFVTLIHEFGHGMGLAHPHDNGGRSGVMNGVTANGPVADYTTGDFALNQAVHTMMSYQDGWPQSPFGNAPTNVGYGYLGGPMAFDIAVLQDKYGVNEDTARGDDTYMLKDVNAAGTFYSSIWDAAGNDTIAYDGARDSTIDLRPATLKYEIGGGGNVSFAFGIFGGYTIANGVTIENARTSAGNDTLIGNAANNLLDSGAGNDRLDLSQGGDDRAIGGAGDDGFFFGKALTAADRADGGAGADQLGLQGNYAGLVLGDGNLVGIETLVLLTGADTRFGDRSNAFYSYNLTSTDANVAAGQTLTVNMNTLRGGENVVFDGSAEKDGTFLFYGGSGSDVLSGGAGSDAFFFGTGKFNAGDRVNGGSAGEDQLGLQGDFAGANAIVLGASQVAGIETIVLLTGLDPRFGGGGGSFSYDLTTNDGNVENGVMTINGNTLRDGETLTFNGSAEDDSSYTIFSGAGADSLTGGQQADTIFGGAGRDTLRGGAGADTLIGGGGADSLYGDAGADLFRYDAVSDSAGNDVDAVFGFERGVDKIDLSGIDADANTAGNQAFAYIGEAAFSGKAGELRFSFTGAATPRIEADVNGDGVADLTIVFTTTDNQPLTGADFVF